MKEKQIDIHADDFGITLSATKGIISCVEQGNLESMSVIANMDCFSECIAYWKKLQEKRVELGQQELMPLLCVHLNFIDGCPLSIPNKVPHLVDNQGIFNLSWGKLFLTSFIRNKKYQEIKSQLKIEMIAQIEKVREVFGEEKPLRIDSHQHTHMNPIMVNALMEVIDEEGYEVEFVRVSKEPIMVFLKETSLYKTYSPINFVKNIILNILASNLEKKLEKRKIDYCLMWGLVMSGHMDKKRVEKLLPNMVSYAQKKGKKIEILFHPGISERSEIEKEKVQEDTLAFYFSEGRKEEFEAVMEVFAE